MNLVACCVLVDLHLFLVVYNLVHSLVFAGTAPPTAPSRPPAPPQPSNATSPSQTGLSSYYTAVGFAGVFAFLFLLAAIAVLVLVCAVVAVSRRNRKSIASRATELEVNQQGESLLHAC